MANPYLGQLLLASFNFAPRGYAQCNGQVMSIQQNAALFSLLGTFYGGNGIQTFALPNLQGRTALGTGDGFTIGQIGGEVQHTLTAQEVPLHTHQVFGTGTNANVASPKGALLALAQGVSPYVAAGAQTNLNNATLTQFGGSQPHPNQQPFLVLNWCISLSGIFPSQN
jgi:microcystin-dependent protein